MCDICLEHTGLAPRWYLNPENFKREKANVDFINEYLGHYELCNVIRPKEKGVEWLKELTKYRRIQAIPWEDAVQILKIAKKIGEDDFFAVATHCPCRKLRGAGTEEPFCINWGIIIESAVKVGWGAGWPDHLIRKPQFPVDPDNFEGILKEWERKYGVVHTVASLGVPFIGTICNCEWPYCHPMKQRFVYNIPDSCLKGHYVAQVNPNKCVGCRNCESQCQFGAIRVRRKLGIATVDVTRCFGCGVCRETCTGGAIELVDRAKVPLARNLW